MRHEDYEDHWRRYKRLRNVWWFSFLGYVPAGLAFTVVVARTLGSFTPGFFFAGIWMVAFVVLGNRLSNWPCPRCGKAFSGTWWYNKGSFARRCVHCQLPKFATDDANQKAL